MNHGIAMAENYGLRPGDRVLCSASIGFDVMGEQIYPALLSGAEVVVRPDDLFDSFAGFDAFVRAEGISAMVLPTAFWHEWVRELQRGGAPIPLSLRSVSTGTEKVLGKHLATWQQKSAGRVRFFQGYGPTETTITCTMYVHDSESFDAERAVPIGRPLPNTRVHILDSAMEPVPVGVPGEIYVGGVGLARGYRANPAMTAERFVADPFRCGGRLYRTGDIGRYEPDGQIVYITRTDSQIKIRGHRVELGEIENVLRAHSDVDDAVVIFEPAGGQNRLVAYVVTRGHVDPKSLIDHAGAHLPEYMMPVAVVQLRAFPKTANQKVDRRALPRPELSGPVRQLARSANEARLQALWAIELGRNADDFGVFDSFFDLGGDSLRAVSMLSAVETAFDTPVLLSAFVRSPTISGLAALLQSPPDVASTEDLVVVVQRGRPDRCPLWLIHAVGGHVVFGNHLRASVHPDQPLLGIQARGLDGRLSPHTSIAAMADEYAALIRATQTDGPYFLAGPSMGGYIAIEVARRLEQGGACVALLALMDAWGPGFPRPTSKRVRLVDNARAFAAMPSWRERLVRMRMRMRDGPVGDAPFEPPRYDVLDHLSARLGDSGATLIRMINAVTHANQQASRGHVVRPFDTPMLLLRADRRVQWSGMRFDDPGNGWEPFARGGLSTIGFDYDHRELVDEPGHAVGQALQAAIDAATGNLLR